MDTARLKALPCALESWEATAIRASGSGGDVGGEHFVLVAAPDAQLRAFVSLARAPELADWLDALQQAMLQAEHGMLPMRSRRSRCPRRSAGADLPRPPPCPPSR